MRFVLPSVKSILFPAVLLLAVYSLSRFLFLMANLQAFEASSPTQIGMAFLHGVRFDVSFLFLWNIPFVLLWCVPVSWFGKRLATFRTIAFVAFALLNIPPVWTNLADAGYFPLSGRRSSLAVLELWRDFSEQWVQLLWHYWRVPAGGIAIAIVIVVVLRRWFLRNHEPVILGVRGFAFRIFLVGFVLVAGIRGSISVKPLGTWDAYRLANMNLGALALNTPFTCLKTDASGRVEKLSYFSSDKEALQVLRGNLFSGDSSFRFRQANVVVMVLESFSLEFFGAEKTSFSYTPYLRSLAEKGYFFDTAFANARSSIQALPSIFLGVPPLLETPYVRSVYNGTRVNGLASILRDRGYSSLFFHGARNGSMYIDTAAKIAGFEQFFGLNEYPEKARDFDGTWGIFDEPFLQFMGQKLSRTQQPFVAGYFSLSSHNPYVIPKEYLGRFPKGKHPILESIGYADYAIQKFMEFAQTQPWYKNTIFVFVADHSVDGVDKRFVSDVGRFRVPLLFFDGGGVLPVGRNSQLAQQLDILPSVIDALGIHQRELKYTIPPFGVSVFDAHSDRNILLAESGNRTLIYKDVVVRAVGETENGASPVWQLGDLGLSLKPAGGDTNLERTAMQKWRAAQQLFQNGLENNSLVRMQR